MATPLTTVSKKKINKAGQILVHQKSHTPPQVREAFEAVSAWRAQHAYPINTFQSTLRDKVRHGYDKPIVAQRLKRMPTIVDKLERFPTMQLARMQDIGGVRAVVKSVKDVYKLTEEYERSRFTHKLEKQQDYILNPRSEDGYRSVHLIYRYSNNRGQGAQYNGLLVELQIRSRLQHVWATAVETMGTLLGQSLKSGRGDKEWIDFFAVTSSAFAHIEGTNLIPRFSHLSKRDTFKAVASAQEELKVLEKIHSYSFAMNRISNREDKKKWSYHLIILNSMENILEIHSYGRDQLASASEDYANAEKRAANGERIESVLVSAGPLDQLKRAYPNYFLDVTDFIGHVRQIIKEVKP